MKSIEVEDLVELEEGTYCSAGLMCHGLTDRHKPAFVGWYLDIDPETDYDVPRVVSTYKFAEDPKGLYCEDCTYHLENEVFP
jgi:hypothetical protein